MKIRLIRLAWLEFDNVLFGFETGLEPTIQMFPALVGPPFVGSTGRLQPSPLQPMGTGIPSWSFMLGVETSALSC